MTFDEVKPFLRAGFEVAHGKHSYKILFCLLHERHVDFRAFKPVGPGGPCIITSSGWSVVGIPDVTKLPHDQAIQLMKAGYKVESSEDRRGMYYFIRDHEIIWSGSECKANHFFRVPNFKLFDNEPITQGDIDMITAKTTPASEPTQGPRKLSYAEALEHMRLGGKVFNNRYSKDVYISYNKAGKSFMYCRIGGGLPAYKGLEAEDIYDAEWTVYEEPKSPRYRFSIELSGDLTNVPAKLSDCTAAGFAEHLRKILNSVGFPDSDINHIGVYTQSGDGEAKP